MTSPFKKRKIHTTSSTFLSSFNSYISPSFKPELRFSTLDFPRRPALLRRLALRLPRRRRAAQRGQVAGGGGAERREGEERRVFGLAPVAWCPGWLVGLVVSCFVCLGFFRGSAWFGWLVCWFGADCFGL